MKGLVCENPETGCKKSLSQPPKPMPNVIAKLEQRALFKGRRAFVIHDNGTVTVTYAVPGLHQELTLQLSGINPNATRQKHVAVDMIIGFAIFLLPTLGFSWSAITSRFGSDPFYWYAGMALLFMLPLGLCWREFLRKSFDLHILTEPLTGNQLVILQSVPDRNTVDGFISTLQAEIQKVRTAFQSSAGPTLSAELERLASLRDRGVLSEPEFQQAKTGLLSGLETRRIGFHT
jgi:hypothetical protein